MLLGEVCQKKIHHRTKRLHQVIDQRHAAVARFVVDTELREEAVDEQTSMAEGGEHSVAVVEEQVGGGLFFLVSACLIVTESRKKEGPVMLGAVGLVDFIRSQGVCEARGVGVESS